MAEIQIMLNGESRQVPRAINLDRLLEFLCIPKQRVAVELNKSVVRRGDWPETVVRDKDKIEVVHFVGGG